MILTHFQSGVSCTFDFNNRVMFLTINFLTPQRRAELVIRYAQLKARKKHGSSRHLVHQSIEPLDQHRALVPPTAAHLDRAGVVHCRGIANDRGERSRRLDECRLQGLPDPANADVRIVIKMLPKTGFYLKHTVRQVPSKRVLYPTALIVRLSDRDHKTARFSEPGGKTAP